MVIGIGYQGASTPEMDPPPLSLFFCPVFPRLISYPQPKPQSCPQIAVCNRVVLHLVFFFL